MQLINEAGQAPDNQLAVGLIKAIDPLIETIGHWSAVFGHLIQKSETPAKLRQQMEQTAEQLDLALARTAAKITASVHACATLSRSNDLLCEAARLAIGDGPEAASVIRRLHAIYPEDLRDADGTISDGGWAGHFAWDSYLRTAALDRLADEFPEQIGAAARNMHAWPMLWHRHVSRLTRFEKVADRLKLGEEYPLEVSKHAKFNPDTPMVAYLDSLLFRLHHLWVTLRMWKDRQDDRLATPAKRTEAIRSLWTEWPENPPSNDEVAVLGGCLALPPLTKTTASEWAEKVVLPFILLTDGRDFRNVCEPAMRQIAGQNGVKSQAIFASRLKPTVKRTLVSMARTA